MKNQVELDERDISKLSKDEQLQKAKEFSEGSPELEEFLLYLWSKGINTFACCTGHAEPDVYDGYEISHPYPYITMDAENINKDAIGNILRAICLWDKTYSLEFSNDLRDNINAKPRKMIEIHLQDIGVSFEDVYKMFYMVLEHGYKVSPDEISSSDREFTGSAVALSCAKVENLDVSSAKKHYQHFPEKVKRVSVLRTSKEQFSREIQLKEANVPVFIGDDFAYICENAYFKAPDGCLLVCDSEHELLEISEEEIHGRGLIDTETYTELIFNLFLKDQNTFEEFLKSGSLIEKEKKQ